MGTVFEFCAQEECIMDANGRLKLSAGVLRDFRRHTEGEVVLYCVPEGAIGVFPPDHWARIRHADSEPLDRFASDVLYRRTLRRFGALSCQAEISPQGRVTIPPGYREYAGLPAAGKVLLVGCEIGVEVWSQEAWQRELAAIQEHVTQKSRQAMAGDLAGGMPKG
jgi:DNA-binding transcriptional regulator/RsmH inhibitor MraZ